LFPVEISKQGSEHALGTMKKRAPGQKLYFYVAVYYVVHAMGLQSITHRKKSGGISLKKGIVNQKVMQAYKKI
jgi:hypothetical protein